MADWRGLEGYRCGRLEGRGVERQELSGGCVRCFSDFQPAPPRILDRNGRLERTRHGVNCADLLDLFCLNNIKHSLVNTNNRR